MAAIDLIVSGMLKKEPMDAYDIQKLVEYRNISKWVKISTPSICKKAIRLGEKGFERLMLEIAAEPVHIFLDLNAVIVNIDSLSSEMQKLCIKHIEENIKTLKSDLEENISEKEHIPEISETGMAVLRQQFPFHSLYIFFRILYYFYQQLLPQNLFHLFIEYILCSILKISPCAVRKRKDCLSIGKCNF